jgi:hypothetical protein
MRKSFLIISLLFCAASFGQSLKKLKVFCTDSFDPRASLTVEALRYDPCLAADALKNQLVTNGFKVISERVAKEKLEISSKGTTSDSTFDQNISAGRTTYLKSVYVITLNYNSRGDTGCGGTVISDLSGQIVDLANDGEIVATFTFKQGALEGKCASTIMEALAKALKEKQKSK